MPEFCFFISNAHLNSDRCHQLGISHLNVGFVKEPLQGQGIAVKVQQQKEEEKKSQKSVRACSMQLVKTPAKKDIDQSISPMEKLNKPQESVSVSENGGNSFHINVVREQAEEPSKEYSQSESVGTRTIINIAQPDCIHDVSSSSKSRRQQPPPKQCCI